jgi:hypothetical protein
MATGHKRLGEMLIEAKLPAAEELDAAIAEQRTADSSSARR